MATTVMAVAAVVSAIAGVGTAAYSVMKGSPSSPKPPPYKPEPLPPPKKKEPEAPVPGIEEKAVGAGARDERRRILAGLPKQTKNTYGGDAASDAPIAKKSLLGGGTGRETTGV